MGSIHALIVCLAFVLGLLFTAIPFGGWILLGLGMAAALLLHRFWRTSIRPQVWLLAGAIALLATFYLPLRTPQPQPHDISRLLSPQHGAVNVLVEGQVTSLPRLTRSQKSQFWLQVAAIAPIGDGRPVTGKVYTTVPPEQASHLHPGQRVQVSGSLYLPQAASHPGGFDFQNFLQQEGSFAGLRGDQVTVKQDTTGWGGWQMQQRIVQAQHQSLGSPEGPLVSAMVLGGRAVDLPYDVKDIFVRVGLAHALAASGFQTSLILGVVLALTRRTSERIQFMVGSLALAGFVGLAGWQPAVLRAALMGFGGLVALVLHRQMKPLGALLLTAVILLLINPLWIWDLGFQLSFLATMGLLVTVPHLNRQLDWVPPAIAPLITVPIAAYLWTLPLQLGAFGVLSPYSIPANLVTTPLISLISLGGMVSAVVAIGWPAGGSALAWWLEYPTQALIAIARGFNQLPGNGWAVGTISVVLVLGLYSLLGLSSFHRWWQKRWWLALGMGVVLVLLPVAVGASGSQATVLATPRSPVLVWRERGRVLVIGGGEAQTVQFTLLPYLQTTGINQIDWAIAMDRPTAEGWADLAQRFPVRYLLKPPVWQASLQPNLPPTAQTQPIPLGLNQTVKAGTTQVSLLSVEPAIAQFTIGAQTWLWLNSLNTAQQQTLLTTQALPQAQVLWWSGRAIQPELVQMVKPSVAIASTKAIEPETVAYFKQHNIPLYVTGLDGAIQWTPAAGFSRALDASAE
ncbi:MAG: ComEC/Rec2 family competence protein [Leptolyngbyaceae cyanobacterium bins.349]|nr:ComEC/Rec2 family competence protein [Leptolyngbyaceae cyanobacterium bins.349]